jgi:cell wall-associated NlpC family hydrolase
MSATKTMAAAAAQPAPPQPTADAMIALAMAHLGEDYDFGADVPLDNGAWRGPWDCAEFASWLVYQMTGTVMGCTNNAAPLKTAEPYSGAWARDAEASARQVPLEKAGSTRGAVLVRKPRQGKIGHVAISRGDGTTIEAMDTNHGVAVGKIAGRKWDFCVKIEGIAYAA